MDQFKRIQSPGADAILGKKYEVLDHGYVALMDYMGGDESIARAARTSYDKGTKTLRDNEGLIRYMMRHAHTGPFEFCQATFLIHVPLYVWAQLKRHRTACLVGSTELHFDLPGGINRRGSQLYKLTIEQVYEKFQPSSGERGNPNHKRDRVQGMLLRSVDEETLQVRHTRIVDVWQSGVKPVYDAILASGKRVRASKDHLFFTADGWKKLSHLEQGDRVLTVSSTSGPGVIPSPNVVDEATEIWAPIPEWEEYYEVSDQGRVRRVVGGSGARSYGRCKKNTLVGGRAVVSLNRPGEQTVQLVHRLVLRAFKGEPGPGEECCHNNGNSLDNRLSNLRWGTPSENAEDRVKHGGTTSLGAVPDEFVEIVPAGEEMTYDLEVEGPHHNFSANGVIVHNSINERSYRYSEAGDTFQHFEPGEFRFQSTKNKQGSEGVLTTANGQVLAAAEREAVQVALETYRERIANGVAREQARTILPQNIYTMCYWRFDLHNLLHFLKLRLNPHAQKEARDYALAMSKIVSEWVPMAWEAFNDYVIHAVTLTGPEVAILFEVFQGTDPEIGQDAEAYSEGLGGTADYRISKREQAEFRAKLDKLGLARR